ncbi:hypothetical protein WBP07_10280 [Novosphingobium sp. BL-8A]|uniref:hypothetical protein n=1 Tax=Novosphingobium sp. BL-8A TaxID=3127639 RepID=UPI0037565CD9
MLRRTIAASSLILASLAVSGCGGGTSGDDETYVEESPAAEPPCADPLADPAVLARNRNADRALKAALASGRADPIEEAQKAAAAGDFRLVAAVTVEGIDTREFGAICALRGGLNPRMARVVTYYGEDGEPSPEPSDTASGAAEGGSEDKLVAFARAFNQTLIADPAYPYRDVCRPLAAQEADAAGKDVGSARGAVVRAVSEAPTRAYGFPDLGPLQTGATLADAARRGNVAAMRRMLDAEARELKKAEAAASDKPGAKASDKPTNGPTDRPTPVGMIDAPDLFGMTPLAWAMAYHRDEAVRFLLSRHASPSGAQCQALVDRDSPMQIARASGWVGMVQRMKPMVSEDDYAALAEEPKLADGSKADFNSELGKLGERYGTIFHKDEMTRHALTFKVDAHGKMTSCEFAPKTISPEFDADICKLGRDVLEWQPGRDSEGRPLGGEGKVMIRLRGT